MIWKLETSISRDLKTHFADFVGLEELLSGTGLQNKIGLLNRKRGESVTFYFVEEGHKIERGGDFSSWVYFLGQRLFYVVFSFD